MSAASFSATQIHPKGSLSLKAMDDEEDCFVFPAVTKPYSQVTPASTPRKDPTSPVTVKSDIEYQPLNIKAQPKTRLLTSNTQPQSKLSAPPRYVSRSGSRDQTRKFLRVPQSEATPRRGLLKTSNLMPANNDSEVRKTLSSIHTARKYSVVDPSTLKCVEGT